MKTSEGLRGDVSKNRRDALMDYAVSDFERKLIRECRKDGMTDDEIRRWLKQL